MTKIFYLLRTAPPRVICWLFVLSLPAIIATRSASAEDVTRYNSEYAVTYDNNVNRAGTAGTPLLADGFVSYRWSRSKRRQTERSKRKSADTYFGADIFSSYTGLSKFYAGLSRTYQRRRSGNFGVPTYSWFVDGRLEYFPLSAMRNGFSFKFGGARRKQVTDRINFYSALTGRYRVSQGAVFDTLDASLLFNIDYVLARRKTLYLAMDIRQGDVVASADPSTPAASYVTTFAQAIEDDTAFANQFAYRLDASTLIYSIGYNQVIGANGSIDFSLRAIRSSTVGGFTYDANQISIAYLKQI